MLRNITPMERLERRIKKEFYKRRLIGDIAINDEEFELLKIFLRQKFTYMYNSGIHIIIDEVLCVALVQIGIRFYDGKFWPHVKSVLGSSNFNSNHQVWFGKSFVNTLALSDKTEYEDGNWMNSILMHCFVSNVYSANFFNFLFAFYRIDLERDISRLDREAMNELVEIIKRNDNSGRTYWLVEHTASAVRCNVRGGKTRIRRYLKLIDKAFWGDPLPENSENRLTQLFIEWTKLSDDFILEKKANHETRGRRKKSYASPYIKFNTSNPGFDLILPQQIVRFDDVDNLYWKVTIGERTSFIEINHYMQVVTGYKTDEERIFLEQRNIFSPIVVELFNSSERLRFFRIAAEPIRFFDDDGDHINIESIPTGEVFSFTSIVFKPESEAIIEFERMGELLYTRFDFVEGDIVRFPDGKPISIGRKLQEAILPRGIVRNVQGIIEEKKGPVYSSVPTIFIKTSPKKINGTALSINGVKTHISNGKELCSGITSFDLLDRSGERGYLFDLSYWGCNENGIYNIEIDIPNDRSNRSWSIVYIKDFSFEFEDAPYIFKTRGTLSVPKKLSAKPISKMTIDHDETNDYFNFDISPEVSNLYMAIEEIQLEFEIPMLSYAFDGEGWETALHKDIWHSEFNPKLIVKYHTDKIKFSMEEDYDDESYDDCFVEFVKNKTSNQFECDLNRIKSWFGHEKARKTLYLELPDKKDPIPFLGIVLKSVLISAVLQGDFDNDVLVGNFDIIGKAEYYVDILYNRELIAEKETIQNGKISFSSKLETGKYEVHIFESEEDEFGFGDQIYCEIGRKELDLINPLDLNGKSIAISSIYPAEKKAVKLPLSCRYIIQRLESASEDDKHNYRGLMVVEGRYGNVFTTFPVNVEIFDFSKLYLAYITFVEDGDTLEFLYDESRMIIVKEEDPRLTKSQAYRRYKRSLYPEDYVFKIEFTAEKVFLGNIDRYNVPHTDADRKKLASSNKTFYNATGNPDILKGELVDEKYIGIEDMGICSKACSGLSRYGIKTPNDIAELDLAKLLEIESLDKDSVCEVIEKMEAFGFKEWAQKINADLREINKLTDIAENAQKTANTHSDSSIGLLSASGLSPMAYNCLKQNNIRTIEDLNLFLKEKGEKGLQNLYKMNGNLRNEVVQFARIKGLI